MKTTNVPTTATDDGFTMAICSIVDTWLEQKVYFDTLKAWAECMPDDALNRLQIPTAGQFEEFVEKVSRLSADHDVFTIEQIQEIIKGLDQEPDLPNKRIDRIRKYVKERFHEKYYHQVPSSGVWKDSNDIIAIGTSILCTAWNVGPKGGSFVQAVADNDLYLAFKRADSTNRYCLDFYSELVHETTPIR